MSAAPLSFPAPRSSLSAIVFALGLLISGSATLAIFFRLTADEFSVASKIAVGSLGALSAGVLLFGDAFDHGQRQWFHRLTKLGRLAASAATIALVWTILGVVADQRAAREQDEKNKTAAAALDEANERLQKIGGQVATKDGVDIELKEIGAAKSEIDQLSRDINQVAVALNRLETRVEKLRSPASSKRSPVHAASQELASLPK